MLGQDFGADPDEDQATQDRGFVLKAAPKAAAEKRARKRH